MKKELTKHQEEALKQSLNILKVSDKLLIKGSAGVGKTFMVNALIEKLYSTLSNDDLIYCCATTNKAVSVLQSKIDETSYLRFNTIHSAFRLKREDKKDGTVTFKPSSTNHPNILSYVKLIIIDEASMINDELLNYIEMYSNRFKIKVVFIGDDKQLNPIGLDLSPVFTQNYPTVELTEIVRQAESNPIINLSRNLDLLDKGLNKLVNNKGYFFTENYNKIIDLLVKANGTDEVKYIAWTNECVDRINKAVREKIYNNPAQFEKGEILLFNKSNRGYFANEEVKVVDIRIDEEDFPANHVDNNYYKCVMLKSYQLTIKKLSDNSMGIISVIHEDSKEDYNKFINQMKDDCISGKMGWRNFYNFTERFHGMTYNHAITAHKAQGSTYKTAIINAKNMKYNSNLNEQEKLLYTAITRASDLVIIDNS